MNEQAVIRACVESGWSSGAAGKGLLVVAGGERPRLVTWRTLSWGGPHHVPTQEALGLSADDVAAYLGIAADGSVELYVGDIGLIDQVLALDSRLKASKTDWQFD